MPTPKRTPASTRFEPLSPKAKVRLDTTIATKERPRAIVLVNACCRTLTAFSQGEATLGEGRCGQQQAQSGSGQCRNAFLNRRARYLLCLTSSIDHSWRVLAGIVAARRHPNATGRTECLLNLLGRCQGTLGALAPCSRFLPSRPERRPSAGHDAWRVTRLNQVHQAPGEHSAKIPLVNIRNIRKGKSKKKF